MTLGEGEGEKGFKPTGNAFTCQMLLLLNQRTIFTSHTGPSPSLPVLSPSLLSAVKDTVRM